VSTTTRFSGWLVKSKPTLTSSPARAADREVMRPWGAGCQPQALSLVVKQADGLCQCGQPDKPPYLNEAPVTAARRVGLLVFPP
jgi:hypothetical protein